MNELTGTGLDERAQLLLRKIRECARARTFAVPPERVDHGDEDVPKEIRLKARREAEE